MVQRVDILGVGIHALTPDTAVQEIAAAVRAGRRGYVCVTGVHGLMEAQDDPEFLRILNAACLVTPDGMPTVWVGRLRGHRGMRRVYGPDLMLQVCARSVREGWRHYLYGGHPGVAMALGHALATRFPGLRIVGADTPPFRPLTPPEEAALIVRVRQACPDLLWVGLGTPKQERFMARMVDRLEATVMLGVGAAFDVHTGRVRDAPGWVKRAGLQWLHRLAQEPRRLGPRYLRNNPRFIWRVARELAGVGRVG